MWSLSLKQQQDDVRAVTTTQAVTDWSTQAILARCKATQMKAVTRTAITVMAADGDALSLVWSHIKYDNQ